MLSRTTKDLLSLAQTFCTIDDTTFDTDWVLFLTSAASYGLELEAQPCLLYTSDAADE